MRSHTPWLIVLCFAPAACHVDRTITHGADGSPEWDRRLKAAVSIGTSIQDARRLMERNGFACEDSAGLATELRCAKTSSGLVQRRWQAEFAIEDERVGGVRSSTELTGP